MADAKTIADYTDEEIEELNKLAEKEGKKADKPAPKTIRVGIIGCGGIANGKHMPNIKKIPGVEMVAFCDLKEARAVKAAKKYGTPDAKIYFGSETAYKELLKDETIEVIHVCTPNRSHSFITVDALDAGKHVMCEKPMAINSEEAKKMLDAAERSGKKLTIGYQQRWRKDSQYAKEFIKDGGCGDIYYGEAVAIRRRAVPTWGVFLNAYEQGGGPLIDIGTHALDLTLWLMDNYKPKMVVGKTFRKLADQTGTANAWGDWDPEEFTTEDSAFGFIVMENGAVIYLKSSWAINLDDPHEAECVLAGTKAGISQLGGGLKINAVRGGRQVIEKPSFDAGGVAFFDGASGGDPAQLEQMAWYDAIRNDTAPPTQAAQAYVVTQILEAIYTSEKTGQPIYFN
ncbi:MAG: Gfo/Idh/MocA family oxidoreductase [Oscillospiraceae bacterium]|jgi:predicted dehydrogenase|nr:Gfo/Idh/MocA family oxidoreductase [Oscillospiraceae bacterium]